jgi:hypothetical protein
MDLTDERLHKRRVPWSKLVDEGYDPRTVMREAQKQGLHTLASKARTRIDNQRREARSKE